MRRFPLTAILLAALLPALLAGCAHKVNLPAVTPDAGFLSYPGKFVWFDLYAEDMGRAARFYDNVFGWSVERTDRDSPRVKTILNRGRRIGSIFLLGSGGGEPGWVVNLSVPDVDAAYAATLKAGGVSLHPPEDRPHRGRMAEVRDPQNARLVLLTSPVGDPREYRPVNGAFMGAELWAQDVSGAEAFYAGLAGYRGVEMNPGSGSYVMLMSQNRPRGAITSPRAGVAAPLWIPQVAVRDVEDVISRVEAHGGTVLLRSGPGDKTGRTAVFRDPAGGLMGVREFTPVEK